MKAVDDRLQAAASELRDFVAGTPLPRLGTVEAKPRRHRVRNWAVAGATAVAVLVVIGGTALLLRGPADTPELGVTDPVVSTTAPVEVTVSTETPPSTVTTSTAAPITAPPVAPQYDEILDGSAAAFFTAMELANDGSPVIVSYVRDPAFGDDPPTTSALRLIRCGDPQCVETPLVVDLGEVGWQGGRPDLKLDPFDRPLIGYVDALDRPTVAFCADAECSGFEVRHFNDDAGSLAAWSFTPDGNPVFMNVRWADSATSELVVCLDRFCDSESRVSIDNGVWHEGVLRVTPEGSLLVAYSTGAPLGAAGPEAGHDGADHYGILKVASCADVTCPGGVVITSVDEGVNLGGGIWISDGEIWYLAHMGAAAYTYGRAICLNTECTEISLDRIGPFEMAGWAFAETVAPDGSRLQLFKPAAEELQLVRYRQFESGSWDYTTVATFPAEGFDWASDAALGIGAGGLPLIAYGDIDGLHLIRCPDMACTLPDAD